ncbi:hypothetical protein [Actinoplanes sp. NBRC 101535]|uniref:hypothetical protein n=1 Tax=Actinoplanes sp. NBRC 101535 TaxID=3032196 RepID=UPI0024A56DB5|nr:hypothetical protein [Actinoplanes sp. NBRC 101535]GLY01904.1 hypothetical protein Acsp01_22830 [Actinoplanes sp. NBRC 101535]
MGPSHRLRTALVRFGGTSLRSQVMTAVALVATAALVLGVLWADHDLPAGDPDPGDTVRVGVVEGQTVAGYLDSARVEMDRLTDPSAPASGETWALVSLIGYVSPDALPLLFGDAVVAQVYARVPLPEIRTPVTRIPVYRMPEDVTAGMLAAAVVRDREQADYQRLSRALTGAGRGEEQLRQTYEAAAHIAAREAAAYRAGCACVFAAVVRALPAALSGLAGSPQVRAVDPAPEVRGLDSTEFRPPLPEEVGTVSPEPSLSDRAAGASGDPAVASTTAAPIPSSIGARVTSASPDAAAPVSVSPVLPSGSPVAVPSASDTSPAHEGSGVPSGTPAATSGG